MSRERSSPSHPRRVERHVVRDGTESSFAARPLAQARHPSPAILPTGRAHAGVLDEEHAAAGARQYGHHALVFLPEEIPVDRRDVDDVSIAEHAKRLAGACRACKSPCGAIGTSCPRYSAKRVRPRRDPAAAPHCGESQHRRPDGQGAELSGDERSTVRPVGPGSPHRTVRPSW
jgi:hypothetical protein